VYLQVTVWSTSERLVVELLTIGAIQVTLGHCLSFPYVAFSNEPKWEEADGSWTKETRSNLEIFIRIRIAITTAIHSFGVTAYFRDCPFWHSTESQRVHWNGGCGKGKTNQFGRDNWCSIAEVLLWILTISWGGFSYLRVCRIAGIVLPPETLHTLRGEETTHMNSHVIITAGLGVPLSTGPSAILFDVRFYFILLPNNIL